LPSRSTSDQDGQQEGAFSSAEQQLLSLLAPHVESNSEQSTRTEPQSSFAVDVQNSQDTANAGSPGKRPREVDSSDAATRTNKRARKSPATSDHQPRPQAQLDALQQATSTTVDGAVQTPAQNDEPDQTIAPKTRRRPRKNGEQNQVPADRGSTTSTGKVGSKPRKPRQRKKPPAATDAGADAQQGESENAVPTIEADQNTDGSPLNAATKWKVSSTRKRRQKKSTESGTGTGTGTGIVVNEETGSPDPELHEIDPRELSMWDLSHDAVRGKTSELGRRMAAIDWKEVALKRRLEESGIAVTTDKTGKGVLLTSIEGQDGEAVAEAAEAVITETNGDSGDIELQMDADGNIIANDDALVRVLNAEAEAAANSGEPVVEENPLTTRLNRTSWINANKRDPADRVPMWKGKSDPWSEEETDRFYEALGMFGTDFFIISKMFAPKTRRMIKHKFVREERLDPERINRTLLGLGSKPMDLEHYARETGTDVAAFSKYATVEEADAAMREELKGTAARMTTAIEQEAAIAEDEAEQEKLAQQERSRGGRKPRKNRQMKAGGLGGGGPDEG
jgi:transcription factor TFIIIB component B''